MSGYIMPRLQKEVRNVSYLFFIAVIANQYTKPGVKPTMSGIHTGHPSTTLAMK